MELSYEEELVNRTKLPSGLTLKDLHSQQGNANILAVSPISISNVQSSLLFDEEVEEEDAQLLNDDIPIANGPVKVKRISDAQRNRMQETYRLQREAKERKRLRQMHHVLDQYITVTCF